MKVAVFLHGTAGIVEAEVPMIILESNLPIRKER